jgi:hypothetical protein
MYQRPAEGIMYIMDRPSNIMRHCTPTLLQLPLQPAKNVIERQPALLRWSDAPTAQEGASQREQERSAAVRLARMPGGEDDAFCELCWACVCWCC